MASEGLLEEIILKLRPEGWEAPLRASPGPADRKGMCKDPVVRAWFVF